MKHISATLFVLPLLVAALSIGAQAQQAPPPAQVPTLKIGDAAPDFSLQGSDGKTHKLSDFRGKQAVVIAWFPAAFTGGCTIECKSLAANGDKIRAFNVSYFMASTDAMEGEKGNKAFAETYKADFPMLSDPTKETAKAYGVLNARGTAQRWTFYIDKQGKIAFIDTGVAARVATSAEDMVAKLTELRVEAKK